MLHLHIFSRFSTKFSLFFCHLRTGKQFMYCFNSRVENATFTDLDYKHVGSTKTNSAQFAF